MPEAQHPLETVSALIMTKNQQNRLVLVSVLRGDGVKPPTGALTKRYLGDGVPEVRLPVILVDDIGSDPVHEGAFLTKDENGDWSVKTGKVLLRLPDVLLKTKAEPLITETRTTAYPSIETIGPVSATLDKMFLEDLEKRRTELSMFPGDHDAIHGKVRQFEQISADAIAAARGDRVQIEKIAIMRAKMHLLAGNKLWSAFPICAAEEYQASLDVADKCGLEIVGLGRGSILDAIRRAPAEKLRIESANKERLHREEQLREEQERLLWQARPQKVGNARRIVTEDEAKWQKDMQQRGANTERILMLYSKGWWHRTWAEDREMGELIARSDYEREVIKRMKGDTYGAWLVAKEGYDYMLRQRHEREREEEKRRYAIYQAEMRAAGARMVSHRNT